MSKYQMSGHYAIVNCQNFEETPGLWRLLFLSPRTQLAKFIDRYWDVYTIRHTYRHSRCSYRRGTE